MFLAVDVVWLANSSLRFDPANWNTLAAIALAAVLTRAIALRIGRVRTGRGPRVMLAGLVRKSELLWRGGLLLALIGSVFLVFMYLATAAALPLRDDFLAGVDRWLGFDWPGFLAATNGNATIAAALTIGYHSTAALLVAIVVWFSVTEQEVRLAELLAVLSLTFVGLAVGMVAVPTAGAFAHFAPAPQLFGNFAEADHMWPFYRTFAALRDGRLTVIAFASADGVVGFPSFHAALGVVTVWIVRHSRLLVWPVLALNAVMMVAVLPVGGHHLAELLGGTLTGIAAVTLVSTVIASAAKQSSARRRRAYKMR